MTFVDFPTLSRLTLAYTVAMKHILLTLVAVLAVASSASAQAVTSWTIKVYDAGTQTLRANVTVPLAAVSCNQTNPSATPANPANPNQSIWDDPANLNKSCIFTDTGTGPYLSMTFGGSFETTLTANNVAGPGLESPRVPFTRPGQVPGVVTGYRLK